jgi:MFS family permease
VSVSAIAILLHRFRPGGAGFDGRLFAPMMLGAILNPINSSMIAVALVPIGVAFGVLPSATAWLISVLYLATATGQPVVGRLVDMWGPRPLFLAGAGLVGVAGVLGTLAPDFGVLIAARVLLGLGTCAGYPAAMYLIRSEARRTGHDSPAGVLTALSIATQTIAVFGPSLGGLLIGLGGWRAIFAVNIPLGAAALILGALRLPRTGPARTDAARTDPARTDPAQRVGKSIDAWGIVLFAAMLIALMLFLMDPHPSGLWLLAVTGAAAAGFALRELRVAEPFIDLRVFAGNGPLLRTYARSWLAYVVSYAFIYGFTQWMEAGRRLSASQAGLVLLPTFAAGIVVAAITGRRTEIRGKLVVAALAQVLACALLLILHGGSAILLLVVIAAILGVPQGLASLATQNAVYWQADPARIGASAGLLRTFGYLGAIVASAANGLFFRRGATTAGMHHLALFMLGAAVLFLLVTIFDRSLKRVGARTDDERVSP